MTRRIWWISSACSSKNNPKGRFHPVAKKLTQPIKIQSNMAPILFLFLLLTGCINHPTAATAIPVSSPSPAATESVATASPARPTSSPSPTAAEFVPPTPTPTVEPTDNPGCKWPPIEVTTIFSSYRWSENGEILYFVKNEGDPTGQGYSVSTGQISGSIPAEEIVDPSLDVIASLRKIADEYGIEEGRYFDIFVSPDNNFVIYTKSTDESSTDGLYLKRKNEDGSQFIGNIRGDIDRHTWIHQGSQLILSIDYRQKPGAPEAYVYLVDLDTWEVRILIPASDEYARTLYYGVTPDEKKIIIATPNDHSLLRTWDLAEQKEEPTAIVDSWTYQDIPGTNKILTVSYTGVDRKVLALYIYDFDTKAVQSISTFSNQFNPNISVHAVQISPNLKYIAYVDRDNLGLYLINCSSAIP